MLGAATTSERAIMATAYRNDRDPRALGDVEQRLYATLLECVPVRGPEQELCRKLACLAQLLYEQRDLSDEDVEDILHLARGQRPAKH